MLRVSQAAMVACVLLLVLPLLLLTTPGSRVIWFAVAAVLAMFPAILGPRRYRYAGFGLLRVAALLFLVDYQRALVFQQRQAAEIAVLHDELAKKAAQQKAQGVDAARNP